MAIRSMPAPASRSASRTDRPRRAPCRTARSEPSGGASRGRPTAGFLRRAPRTEPAAPPAMRGFPKKPPRFRQQNPDRIGTGPPGERPTALRRADRSPSRPSRVNAEGGSRACVFRLRAADPKAYAACRRKMLAPTLSRTDFTVLFLLKRSRRIPALRVIFLCMKEAAPTIDAHVIHKTIHSERRIYHRWRFAAADVPRTAIPARPSQGDGRAGSAQASAPVDAAAGWAAPTTVSVFQRPSRVLQGMD